jgi:hypothetical protein
MTLVTEWTVFYMWVFYLYLWRYSSEIRPAYLMVPCVGFAPTFSPCSIGCLSGSCYRQRDWHCVFLVPQGHVYLQPSGSMVSDGVSIIAVDARPRTDCQSCYTDGTCL